MRRLLFLAAVTLLSSTAQARWLEGRSPGFVVRSDGGEGALRQSIDGLEEYDRLLRRLTGTTAPPSPRPLDVYLVRSNDRLRAVHPVSGSVLGFYVARVGGTAAFAVRGDRPGMGGGEVLFHEYAHHFMARYFPAHYPTWYGEGFAEYVATARFQGDRVEVGRVNPARAITLLQGSWLPVERIMAGGTPGLSRMQVG